MSNSPSPSLAKKKKSRVGEIVALLVILGGIAGAAFYQEQITAFYSLRLWDKSGPSRVVEEFLNNLKKGDKAAADALMDISQNRYQPLEEGGKWNGYFIVTQAGKMVYKLNESVPAEIKASGTEFTTIGTGSADVTIKDGKGKDVVFRLALSGGSWKITEMRGGYPEIPKPNPNAKAQRPRNFTPPGSTPARNPQNPAGGKPGAPPKK
jgi:hypothetical protein